MHKVLRVMWKYIFLNVNMHKVLHVMWKDICLNVNPY